MLFTKTFTLAVAFAVLDIASAVPQNRNGGNNNNNNNNNGNTNTGNNANTGNNDAASLELLAANLQSASASDGNPNKTAGQAASLTDKANFINFCSGKTITNGQQLTDGSCNGIVMGDMPSQNNMVSSIIINPGPGDNIDANTEFKIQVQVSNLLAGVFTNPQDSYYAAPQQLSGGKIVGHTHVVIQDLGNSLTPSTPPDAKTFAFFKGIDDDGNGNGLLSATVAGGLPAGNYRVCSMSSSSNHQPVLMPVAQRGAQDDCQKFTVGGKGGNTNTNTGTGTGTGTNTGAAKGGVGTGTGTTGAQSGNGNNGNTITGNNNGGNTNTGNNSNGNTNTGNSNGNSNNGNDSNNNGCNKDQNANGQANVGVNGNVSKTTSATSSQSTTSGDRTGCQNGSGQNVDGQANSGNNNNDSSSTDKFRNHQQNSASSTATATGNKSQQTGTMDDGNGTRNGVAIGGRRFQARKFIS